MPEQQNALKHDPLQQDIAQGAFPGVRLAFPELQQGENPMSAYLMIGVSVLERIRTKIWQGSSLIWLVSLALAPKHTCQ